MTVQREKVQTWRRQLHGSLVILKKNARLYYLKPPVLIFGVLFPVFFFLAFKMGRPIAAENVVPGMVAMALWFTASAVGPLVTPWERSAKTYERYDHDNHAWPTEAVFQLFRYYLGSFLQMLISGTYHCSLLES